ncbi:MAG: protein translocase subunit SecD [Candidatus Didemnitutus sp.]|nr:protein translocase subunit SecD [Candidatus Didemnitutus sp.]
MLRRNLWKLILSGVITLWAVSSLLPLKDRDFGQYVRQEATAKQTEFVALMSKAAARVQAGQAPTVFIALKQIGREEKIDLSEFFPEIRLEASLKNIEKRNNILLDELLRQSKGRLQLGLDLKGGVAFTLEVDAAAVSTESTEVRHEKLAKAIEIIGNRVNGLGVTEPIIRPVGDNRIEVQLAGVSVKDNPEVVNSLKKPARLDFKLVHAFAAPPSEVPPGYEEMTLEMESRTGETSLEDLFVKRIPEMTGEGVSDSYPVMDEFGRFKIILKFTSEGREQFSQVTKTIADENRRTGRTGRLAIVLDGKLYSAPTVREQITSDSAEISGSFSQREAIDLANVLNNPLDLPLQVKEQYEVGPSLAKDAISNGIKASILGTVLVCAFMVTYYTVGGVVSLLTLAINLLVILGTMAALGATLTLPGLAGIVLTIGMAVDANILIFERMREEINLGKSLPVAHAAGYDKAFVTIFDAHLTQLLICVVMIVLGTGPIKGFGVTLAIGVFSTLFSVLIFGHVILNMLIDGGTLKRLPMLHIFNKIDIDWMKYGKPAFIVSWSIVLVGVGFLFVRSDKIMGIDFTGGDQVIMSYAKEVDISKIRAASTAAGVTDINPSYQSQLGGDTPVLKIDMPYGDTAKVVTALQRSFPEAKFDIVGESAIGPTIGAEIAGNAALSLGLSLVVILLYIAFRFEFGFGMGAVVATVHDVLMTVGLFVLFGGQFNAPMVAAILAIIGYSVNDTVVVFDRIREELKLNPTGNLRSIVNMSISRVFSRSIITSFTTLLAATALFLLGGGVLRDLAFTFMIGIITGAFSSIFIAAQTFYWWHKGDRKHVEAHDITPKYEWAGASRASE